MDPNATLRIMQAAAAIMRLNENASLSDFVSGAWELHDAFLELDEWLSKGGFLPADWQGRK